MGARPLPFLSSMVPGSGLLGLSAEDSPAGAASQRGQKALTNPNGGGSSVRGSSVDDGCRVWRGGGVPRP